VKTLRLITLRVQIKQLTDRIFDNEESFMELFDTRIDDLISVSFASDYIKVVYSLKCGQQVSDILNYDTFEEWLKELK
jgi:hypothetical protein